MNVWMVFCTFPNSEVAQSVAGTLVEEELAACVNLAPQVTSIYRWQGQVETAAEVLAILKTPAAAYPALEARLRELHPYETPEILALPVERGLEAYVAWVGASVKSSAPGLGASESSAS